MYGPPEYFQNRNRRVVEPTDDSRKNQGSSVTRLRTFSLRSRAQMEANANAMNEEATNARNETLAEAVPSNQPITPEPAPSAVPSVDVLPPPHVIESQTTVDLNQPAKSDAKVNIERASSNATQYSQRYKVREGVKDIDTVFAKDIAYRRPTVYRGVTSLLVSNLSVLTDLEALQERYGHHVLDISVLENGESKPPFHTEKILVKDFLSQVFTNEAYGAKHYLQQRDIKHDLPGLAEDAGLNALGPHALSDLIPEEHCHFPTLYIGSKGIKTSLHYDRSCDAQSPDYQKNDPGKHNLFLQISGSRKFTLFPMHLSEDLVPDEGSKWPHVSKSTTFLHTVLEHCKEEDGVEKQIEYLQNSEYPTLARAWPEKIEITLSPGDVLLIPARWWHYTHIIEGGLALNWWFRVDEGLEAKLAAKLAETGKDAPTSNGKCIIS